MRSETFQWEVFQQIFSRPLSSWTSHLIISGKPTTSLKTKITFELLVLGRSNMIYISCCPSLWRICQNAHIVSRLILEGMFASITHGISVLKIVHFSDSVTLFFILILLDFIRKAWTWILHRYLTDHVSMTYLDKWIATSRRLSSAR